MSRSRIRALLTITTVAGVLAMMVLPAASAGPAPPVQPSPRIAMGMAYDAARGQVVLFGGLRGNGSPRRHVDVGRHDWTQRLPPLPLAALCHGAMAYDAARGQVVLFGGSGDGNYPTTPGRGTGPTGPSAAPAHAPSPGRGGDGLRRRPRPGRAVRGRRQRSLDDTWAWDGTDWTQRHPAHAPSAAVRAWDGLRRRPRPGRAVRRSRPGYLGDTWTWDGTDWTQRTPAHAPSARCGQRWPTTPLAARSSCSGLRRQRLPRRHVDLGRHGLDPAHPRALAPRPGLMGMAYDGARGRGRAVRGSRRHLGDTWTWDGTDWRVPFKARLHLSPPTGPPGTAVQVEWHRVRWRGQVSLTYIDSVAGETVLGTFAADASGTLQAQVMIPRNTPTKLRASIGEQKVVAVGTLSGQKAKAKFTVT